ncbi:MAG: peptide ABC transporter substrate-binding protein [Carboxydocellales bacterium]
MFSFKKMIALLTVFSMGTGLLAGCGGVSKDETPQAASSNTSGMAKEQVIRYNIGTEPETLDPHKATGMTEGTILASLFEGLTRYDKDGKTITPGIAEKWEISTDGLKYTFYLRDAKWSNGDAITAQDFEYSWKRALDPKVASEYAYQLFYLKNAEAYNSGRLKDASQVGVNATNAKTLEVELHTPAPQFMGLTAFETLYPLNQKVVEANPEKWYQDPNTLVSNGPFKLVKWNNRQSVELAKNAAYWDANTVKLQKLIYTLIDAEDTVLIMFETGQIDMAMNPPRPELDRLQKAGDLTITPQLSTYFYRFNVTKKPFDDVRVRKALAMSIDREAIVKSITRAGERPATAFVPYGIQDANPAKDYRSVGGSLLTQWDTAQAKKLLAAAGYPEGKGFPVTSILYNNNQMHAKIAQAIQEMWKRNLGIDVQLINQEMQVYLDNEDKLAYDIARAGWSGDYVDPMTFMDLFVTKGGNNDTGWSNAEYDKAIQTANNTVDAKVRMNAMHQAEKILMDEQPIMPIYFYTQPYLINSKVTDVVLPSFGTYGDFKWAWLAE